MRLWPRTLGVQLIVVISVAIFLSNVAVALWLELSAERQNEADIIERMIERTTSLANLMAIIPPRARTAAADAMGGRYWRFEINTGRHETEQMTPEETAIAQKIKATLPLRHAKAPVEVHIHRHAKQTSSGFPVPPGGRTIAMTVPVVRGTELIASYTKPPEPPWPTELILAATLAVLATSLSGAYVARRVARPLSKLAEAASLAAHGQTAPRVPEDGPDDIRNAAAAFNAMTDQVSRTLASQRQLLSAVGHDLRTPITAMRINIEFVDDKELRERLLHNLGELQDLTEAVLSAAKGTGGEASRQIDLAALAESICADLEELNEPVVWAGPDTPAKIMCRPNEIRRAIRNLIENAVAYGGRATVSLKHTGTGFEVWIEDEGPGIAPEDRIRVFEPFVRLEASRNDETGGTGLGLTLVKAIAEGHGGKVALEDRSEPSGLRARLFLPQNVQSITARP